MNNEMKNAISKRLNDDSWDSLISGAVIKKRKIRNAAILSSTAAVAASLVIAMVFNLNPVNKKTTTLNAFINTQIESTYKEAVNVKAETNAMDVDSLIDDSLTQRGI